MRIEDTEFAATLGRVAPFTMLCTESMVDLARQVRFVLTSGIAGSFVECGVWRGGASFLMADLVREAGVHDRKVWLFDSFEGMPAPAEIDGPAAAAWARNTDSMEYFENCRASLEDVQRSARELELAAYTECVKGWFEDTLPATRDRVGPIAILRIDCDWYSSVRCCLENLYDQVVDGGFVIFDDYYTFDGCAVAVHEFLGTRGLPHRLESVVGRSNGFEYAVFRKGTTTWRETYNWIHPLEVAVQEIAALVPPGETYILVDEDSFAADRLTGDRRRIPFLERDGVYYGAPPDDSTAIEEFERLRRAGARFIVFAWPAFWWLHHYAGLHRHLRSKFRCVLENDRLVAFDLRA